MDLIELAKRSSEISNRHPWELARAEVMLKFIKQKLNTKENFINYILAQKNELQSIVEKKHPIIKKMWKYHELKHTTDSKIKTC